MRYIYSLLIFIGLSGSAFGEDPTDADDIKGKWICERINARDGSGSVHSYEISGKTLYTNFIECGSGCFVPDNFTLFSEKYTQISKGKSNPFKIFVESKNSNEGEDIIVLRTTPRRDQLHLSIVNTSRDALVKDRLWYGICNKALY